MTPEREIEILATLRMFAEADLKAATPGPNETPHDVLGYGYVEFVRRLRDAAEFSSYDPNAIKWGAMADELEAFGREWDHDIEHKHNQPETTPAELESQRRSFAYGNAVIDNPNVTREMVDAAAEKIAREE